MFFVFFFVKIIYLEHTLISSLNDNAARWYVERVRKRGKKIKNKIKVSICPLNCCLNVVNNSAVADDDDVGMWSAMTWRCSTTRTTMTRWSTDGGQRLTCATKGPWFVAFVAVAIEFRATHCSGSA